MNSLDDLQRLLARAEALLAEAPGDPSGDAPPAARLDALRAELARCLASLPPDARVPWRRVRRIEAALALHARRAPAGSLDGLYADVRAAAGDPRTRAGMSAAFLDAPRALGRWRTAALAACALLAVGAVLAARGASPSATEPAPRPLADPRDELLSRLEPATASGVAPQGVARPVGYGGLPEASAPPARDPRMDMRGVARTWHARAGAEARGGVFTFHLRGQDLDRAPIEAGVLLDAADRRLGIRLLQPAERVDVRESN